MELLTLTSALPDDLGPDPVLVVALDGWTDAAGAGTAAAEVVLDHRRERLGAFPADALYDYRDRRPELEIDRGRLGTLVWPELVVDTVRPPSGPTLVVVHGAEPDLRWQTCAADLRELAVSVGADRYVGLGSVPGPIPHTRPVQVICTGSDDDVIDRLGRAHEQVIVPASCQVAWETLFADAGMQTVGLWARVPHYVAGEYPAATRSLLERFSAYLGTPIDLTAFDPAVAEHRTKLDVAASSSDEVTEHVRQLEQLYDAELEAERAMGGLGDRLPGLSEDEVPSAEELGAEIEGFLRGRAQ